MIALPLALALGLGLALLASAVAVGGNGSKLSGVFVPSVEISADKPVSFPADI